MFDIQNLLDAQYHTVGSIKTKNSWPSGIDRFKLSLIGEFHELLKNAAVSISNDDMSSSLIR